MCFCWIQPTGLRQYRRVKFGNAFSKRSKFAISLELYKNPSLIYCTIIPLTPVVTCSIRVTRYSEGSASGLNKPVRATQLCNTLEVTGSNNSTHLSNTGPDCSLCWHDLLSLLNSNSNVPWLEHNKSHKKIISNKRRHKVREEQEVDVKAREWNVLTGKGEWTKMIKALFCLCRDCAVAATIKTWLTTILALRGETAPTHSYVTYKETTASLWMGISVCVCGHTHTPYSQIKTKVTEYLRVLFLSSGNCMPSRRWKTMYNTLRISEESWIYAAHKSCLRHFLWCFGVWQRVSESLIARLW